MDFVTSEYYLYFLPAAFILSIWLSFGVKKYQISILMLMSYLFFWFASGWHLILLLISTCRRLDSREKIAAAEDRTVRIRWLESKLSE